MHVVEGRLRPQQVGGTKNEVSLTHDCSARNSFRQLPQRRWMQFSVPQTGTVEVNFQCVLIKAVDASARSSLGFILQYFVMNE